VLKKRLEEIGRKRLEGKMPGEEPGVSRRGDFLELPIQS
jgi:hypothetical protein